MAIKILVNSLGQHLIADAKQVENKDTNELVGYWLDNPRVVSYQSVEEEEGIQIRYLPYCILSDEQSFTVRADSVVAILEPREDVKTKYVEITTPPAAVEANIDGDSDSSVEDGDNPGLTD